VLMMGDARNEASSLSRRHRNHCRDLRHSILAQFPHRFARHVRRPFIDRGKKANSVVDEINAVAAKEGKPPIVFITLVDDHVRSIGHRRALRRFVMTCFGLRRTAWRRSSASSRTIASAASPMPARARVRRPHRGHQLR